MVAIGADFELATARALAVRHRAAYEIREESAKQQRDVTTSSKVSGARP